MKKFFVLLFLMAIVSISASARKSYITMITDGFITGSTNSSSSYIQLSGEVPEDIENKGFGYNTSHHYWSVSYGVVQGQGMLQRKF